MRDLLHSTLLYLILNAGLWASLGTAFHFFHRSCREIILHVNETIIQEEKQASTIERSRSDADKGATEEQGSPAISTGDRKRKTKMRKNARIPEERKAWGDCSMKASMNSTA